MTQIARALFLLVCFCCLTSLASSQTPLPPAISGLPKNPADILSSARSQNGLEAPGLPAWHLKATYQTFDENGQQRNSGVFEEWWAGPKEYRRSYASKDFTQTEYVTDTGTYRLGDQNFPPLAELLLAARILSPLPEASDVDKDVVLLRRPQDFGKISLECVVMARKMPNLITAPSALFPTYCFDPKLPMLRWSGSYGQRISLYNAIVSFNGRYIAKDLMVAERDNHRILSAHVDTLESLPNVVETDFIPPSGAIHLETPVKINVEENVTQGRIEKKVAPEYPAYAKEKHIEGEVLIHAEIGEDGHIHEMTILKAPDPTLAIAAMQAVQQWQYKPYLLKGKPVRVITDIRVVYSLRG
jgi:TonB family protein